MAHQITEPLRRRVRFTASVMLAPVAMTVAGCASRAPAEPRIDAQAWESPQSENVNHVSSVAVAEGLLPLVYETTQACTVRVVEQDSGKTVAVAASEAGQIVAVSAARGVSVGGTSLRGPLSADHRYAIYIDIHRSEAGPPPPTTEPVKK